MSLQMMLLCANADPFGKSHCRGTGLAPVLGQYNWRVAVAGRVRIEFSPCACFMCCCGLAPMLCCYVTWCDRNMLDIFRPKVREGQEEGVYCANNIIHVV